MKINLKNLELQWLVLISVVLALAISVIIKSFFGNWGNFIGADFLAVIISIMIILKAFSLEDKKTRQLICIGGMFYFLQVITEVVLDHLRHASVSFPMFLWIIVVSIGFIGFLLLLFGFKRLVLS